MSMDTEWISAAVAALRDADSWTGRIHIHKLIFTCGILDLTDTPFEFELYQYGPYSRDIDSTVSVMEAFGGLTKVFERSGYGPRYRIDPSFECKLPERDIAAIRKVANAFGRANASELELIATCLWVEKRENITDDREIVHRVHEIKPKYNESQIEEHLRKARKLAEQVTAN